MKTPELPEPALERAIEAYESAQQIALDFNQPRESREAAQAEANRAAADILELMD